MWLPRHCMKGISHSGGSHPPYFEEVQEVLWKGPHMEETIDWDHLPGMWLALIKVDLPALVKILHI